MGCSSGSRKYYSRDFKVQRCLSLKCHHSRDYFHENKLPFSVSERSGPAPDRRPKGLLRSWQNEAPDPGAARPRSLDHNDWQVRETHFRSSRVDWEVSVLSAKEGGLAGLGQEGLSWAGGGAGVRKSSLGVAPG